MLTLSEMLGISQSEESQDSNLSLQILNQVTLNTCLHCALSVNSVCSGVVVCKVQCLQCNNSNVLIIGVVTQTFYLNMSMNPY